MKIALRRYLVALAMAVVGLVLWVSSFLLWLVLPHGFYPSRQLWIDLHKWSGLVLSVLVVGHLAMHWRWIWQMTVRQLGRLRRSGDE